MIPHDELVPIEFDGVGGGHNRTPAPPPRNVIGVLPGTSPGTTAVEKQKLHRNAANFAGCHALIDPFGLAAETSDVAGLYAILVHRAVHPPSTASIHPVV
ncbi:MAG: DUF1588 domain-containing protein [Planctomycetaceae bacterium]|nr:MAG: DUF1588 domain-containing protein [Planctomycetaceae bacterium]